MKLKSLAAPLGLAAVFIGLWMIVILVLPDAESDDSMLGYDVAALAEQSLLEGETAKRARNTLFDIGNWRQSTLNPITDLSPALPILRQALTDPDFRLRHRAVATIASIARIQYRGRKTCYQDLMMPGFVLRPFYHELTPLVAAAAKVGSPHDRIASLRHFREIADSFSPRDVRREPLFEVTRALKHDDDSAVANAAAQVDEELDALRMLDQFEPNCVPRERVESDSARRLKPVRRRH